MGKTTLLQEINGSRNMRVNYCCDAIAYENYYLYQVGYGIPYFAGARVQQATSAKRAKVRVRVRVRMRVRAKFRTRFKVSVRVRVRVRVRARVEGRSRLGLGLRLWLELEHAFLRALNDVKR